MLPRSAYTVRCPASIRGFPLARGFLGNGTALSSGAKIRSWSSEGPGFVTDKSLAGGGRICD